MPAVTFMPSGDTVNVPHGTELLDAIRKANIEIEASCGGKGVCGGCIVRIISGNAESESLGILSKSAVSDGYVLACRTRLLDEDLIVEVEERSFRRGRRDGKFTDALEDLKLISQDLLPEEGELCPMAFKRRLVVPSPLPGDGLSDLDRITLLLRQEIGKDSEMDFSLGVIRSAADALRKKEGEITLTLSRGGDKRFHAAAIEPGDTSARSYGIAVDIGTTTVAVLLVNLNDREILASGTDYNRQIDCGLDVISRINYARKPERLQELRERVLKSINGLISQVANSSGVKPEEICGAVLAGNTTMIHLLLGLNPEYIRLEPYTPTVLEVPSFTAEEIGLMIMPDALLDISPSVGSYVGGDITSGLLCTDIAAGSEDISLFIDIGTNGELVIGNNEFLMTCACSAGPAFEGGGISCGMRAARGAIEQVKIDPGSGAADCRTIGNIKPLGICGSGMISLLAELYLTGWMDADGRLSRGKPSPAIRVEGRTAYYTLVPEDESGTGKALLISESDIGNIIRAKAAIFSACMLMLSHIGISFQDLGCIYIAGGFGRHLNLSDAKTIGLIPDLPPERFRYIGNSSLIGAYMALISEAHSIRRSELAKRMTYMDLSTEPDYMHQYTGALFIPHTEGSLFPSVKRYV